MTYVRILLAATAIASTLTLVGCRCCDDGSYETAKESDFEPVSDQLEIETASKWGGDSSDTEILAMLVAVNEHEIDVAQEAQSKSTRDAVKEYADMLEDAHEDNLEATKDIADDIDLEPANTAKVKALREKGQRDLDRLASLDGAAFERAFLDAMVKGHQEVLDAIDARLKSGASPSALKTHLEATRTHIAHHLAQAKQLKSSQPN